MHFYPQIIYKNEDVSDHLELDCFTSDIIWIQSYIYPDTGGFIIRCFSIAFIGIISCWSCSFYFLPNVNCCQRTKTKDGMINVCFDEKKMSELTGDSALKESSLNCILSSSSDDHGIINNCQHLQSLLTVLLKFDEIKEKLNKSGDNKEIQEKLVEMCNHCILDDIHHLHAIHGNIDKVNQIKSSVINMDYHHVQLMIVFIHLDIIIMNKKRNKPIYE